MQVLHPLSYMSGNLKKKMEEVLGCRCLDHNNDRRNNFCVSPTSVRHQTAEEEDKGFLGLKERCELILVFQA